MVAKSTSQLDDAGALTGVELVEVSELSDTVTITAATISALGADNSFNDSGDGFIAAGFTVSDRVWVDGFTGDVANNIFVGVITDLTAGKMTIGGTDGDVIVDDAAGEAVTITKWASRRTTVAAMAAGGNLDGLTDVDTTTVAPVAGDRLVFDGAEWVPQKGPIGVVVTKATQNINNNDFATFISFDTVVKEDDPAFWDVAQATRAVAPVDGWYAISAAQIWATNGSGNRWLFLHMSDGVTVGETYQPGTGVQQCILNHIHYLTAGQHVRMRPAQTSGGTLASESNRLSMVLLR